MPDSNLPVNILDAEMNKKKIPDMLNVLTILTFVACGIGILSSIFGFFRAPDSYAKMEEAQGKFDDMPDFAKKLVGPEALEVARKSYENRLPILLLGLVAYGLCLYGAIRMRKLDKKGFPIYVTGELLPILISILFIGLGVLGGFIIALSVAVPVLFVTLYATQVKYLS